MSSVYSGPVIDCDVHQTRMSDDELREYLPSRWREFVWRADGRKVPLMPAYPDVDGNHPGHRQDAYPEKGGPPGSDYELMREQLLDAFGIERALLSFGVGDEAGHADPEFAEAVVRAMNDWNVERWLDGKGDERLCGVCMVPLHVPEHGAAEIRRVGTHPKIAAAFLAHNSLGKPFGHPIYHPVYEAAAELELPLHLHSSGNEVISAVMPWRAGGLHSSNFDFYASIKSVPLHLTSLIVHGVFEKYPNLSIVCAEAGVAWLPWLAASLDAHYEQLREASLWVKKWPSEYLRERVALTTQPIETTSHDRGRFVELLSSFDGIEDVLCFSSDYPHFDTDVPTYLESILPQGWHERVFHENARRHLRLPAVPARQPAEPMRA